MIHDDGSYHPNSVRGFPARLSYPLHVGLRLSSGRKSFYVHILQYGNIAQYGNILQFGATLIWGYWGKTDVGIYGNIGAKQIWQIRVGWRRFS